MREVEKILEILGFGFREEDGYLGLQQNILKELSIPENILGVPLKIIGDSTFANKGIKVLELPSKLLEIHNCAFINNHLEKVIIPRKTKHIGYMAFADNPLLRVVLPPSLEFIDDYTFCDTTDPLILVCQIDSYAHKYSVEHGYNVEVLSSDELAELYED